MEMKEKNHHVLAKALEKLPEYKAPAAVWESIDHAIRISPEDELQEKLKSLPLYEAPDQVWPRIQGQLKGKSRPLLLRPWAIAAIFVVLISLVGVWRMLNKTEVVTALPMTEKKAPLSELSDIQIADFENQMAAQEAELKACIELKADKAKLPEFEAKILQLEEMTQTRDSLSFFLTHGKGRPGTSPRMDILEEKRNVLIKNLHQEFCELE